MGVGLFFYGDVKMVNGVDSFSSAQLSRQDALQRAQVHSEQRINGKTDREPDGDSDDRGSVTATRGQNVNIIA